MQPLALPAPVPTAPLAPTRGGRCRHPHTRPLASHTKAVAAAAAAAPGPEGAPPTSTSSNCRRGVAPRRPLLLSAATAAAAALAPRGALAADLERVDPDELLATPGWVETDTGLIYKTLREGSGDPCFKFVPNPFVKVDFEGFTVSGRKFASTYDERRPFGFQVGILQRVSPGFDEAVYAMRVGERRQVYIPPEMGFGRRGPEGVAPNAPLFYDIELLSLQPY